MKIFLIALLFVISACPILFAAPASEQTTLEMTRGWLNVTGNPLGAKISSEISGIRTKFDSKNVPLYRVVSLIPEGYIVLSTDTEIEPIIAFSASGHFDDTAECPLTTLLAGDLSSRLDTPRQRASNNSGGNTAVCKWAQFSQESGAFSKRDMNGLASINDPRVDPLIKSRWDQGSIWSSNRWVACYNYYTPPGEPGNPNNYISGCVSTAWAQIFRYFQYPTLGVGTETYGIHVDNVASDKTLRGGDGSGGPCRWDLMPLVPGSSTTLEERQAIGALISDIGAISFTSYFENYSPAHVYPDKLVTVFHYGQAAYCDTWNDKSGKAILANLDASLPVMVGINGPNGGHAVVCDGYGYNAGTLYHHLNMGWSGQSDAWYNMPDIQTEWFYTFTSIIGFTYNIYPTGTGEILSGRVCTINGAGIRNAKVRITGNGFDQTVETNERGIYAFTHLAANSQFSISANYSGFSFPTIVKSTRPTHLNGIDIPGSYNGADLVAMDNVELFAPSVIGGHFGLHVQTEVGKTYSLEYKTEPGDAEWTSLSSIEGDGGNRDMIDPDQPVKHRYYRVRRQ